MPELVAFSAELLMRTYHNNPLTVSNTKSLKYICGNFTFEALNLHREKSTLEKIVPQGLIRNTEYGEKSQIDFNKNRYLQADREKF